MNSFTAMMFPDTVPAADQLFPLVLVFQSVVYCQPVERDEKGQNPGFAAKQRLAGRFACEIWVPAPLGPDLERFLRLQNDLRNRGDDYAAQLGHLSLAGMGGGRQAANESRTSILSGLLKSRGLEHQSREQRDLILWQARLVLTLGELFDEQQARLNEDLARINAKQNELLSELRQDTEAPFSLTEQLSLGRARHDGLRNLRLKSWARLHGLGEPMETAPDALITTDRDAFESLLDEYEKITGRQAVELTNIPLPAHDAEGADETGAEETGAAETRANEAQRLFREQAGEMLQTLRAMLQKPGAALPRERALFAAPDGEWPALLEKSFPAAAHGRRLLKLYHFADQEAQRLLLATFGKESEHLPAQSDRQGGAENGVVIGLLA